jgi:pyrroloquinoline quinone biosynthesis protein B
MPGRATGLSALVLGAAAGGGFPQWNCGCRLCCLARAGDPNARPATEASLALSGNGAEWIVVGASADLRQQILKTPQLWPQAGSRRSPIAAVVVIGGDVDALAGLLVLRERHPFSIYAPRPMLELLAGNRIFDVLDRSLVRRQEVVPFEPVGAAGGVSLTLLPMPGKVPLYLESRDADGPEPGPTYAARLEANGRTVIFAPACAEITDQVRRQLGGADVVFFDGTMFTDDEMIAAGLGGKTGRRMGHVPVSGPGGTLERLRDLPGRRILLHINNSNPILLRGSAERRQVEAAGFEIAYDGMEVQL